MPNRIYTSTGIFRAYRKKVLDSLEIESDGKEIHLEILSKALALGYRVKESPAILTSRKKGKSKFKFRKTAISHLVFSVFEKPVIIFGFVGLLTLAIGFLIGMYIVYLRLFGRFDPWKAPHHLCYLIDFRRDSDTFLWIYCDTNCLTS